MNTSVYNLHEKDYYNTSNSNEISTNFRFNHISSKNLESVILIKSFTTLQKNWDTYDAEAPSKKAIIKAISFILWISEFNQDVFFTAPSPDGNIIVELKNYNSILEFDFSNESKDSVCATQNGEFVTEAELNDTTKVSYLKWLICPNGECPPNL